MVVDVGGIGTSQCRSHHINDGIVSGCCNHHSYYVNAGFQHLDITIRFKASHI
jgi:hypothetical protein